MYNTNLIEFASKEEHNFVTSIHTYHDDVTHFARVDGPMLEVFIDPIGQYAKAFDVRAWYDSTKKLIASTEKVRAALAKSGLQEKVDAGK